MWEAVKNEVREFAGDLEMWVWLAAGISTVPLTLAVNAVMGPGLLVALSWAGMTLVWMIALSMRTQQRTDRRENQADVIQMSVDVLAHVELDREHGERHLAHGKRWYSVFVGGEEVGRIEYLPEAHRSRRWQAHYPTKIPSSSAYSSKRRACESLTRRAFC